MDPQRDARSRRRAFVVLLAITAAAFSVGWAQKLPCRWHGYGPSNRHAYTRACYSDVYVAWTTQRLSEDKVPYLDHPVEYPVLMGALMAVAAEGADTADEFFDHTSAVLLAAALAVAATTALLLGPVRVWPAALVAVAPGVVLHGTVNWDLAAAALAGLGLVAWARRKPALAGVALGLGAATKLYPIILVGPILFLCLRAHCVRAWARLATAAACTWFACTIVVFAVAGSFSFGPGEPARNAVLRFFVLNRDRPADWDSLWFVAQELMKQFRGDPSWAFPVSSLNALSAALLTMAMGALGVFLWRSATPARVGQAAFLAVAIFVLSSKVFSPQYTIWLVPLAVIARPRPLPILGWQVLEVVLTVTRFLYFVRITDPDSGLPLGFFVGAVVARDLALVALMFAVVREIREPAFDGVRQACAGDPAGGPLVSASAAA